MPDNTPGRPWVSIIDSRNINFFTGIRFKPLREVAVFAILALTGPDDLIRDEKIMVEKFSFSRLFIQVRIIYSRHLTPNTRQTTIVSRISFVRGFAPTSSPRFRALAGWLFTTLVLIKPKKTNNESLARSFAGKPDRQKLTHPTR